MHLRSLLLLVALLVGGCATRIPLQENEAPRAREPSAREPSAFLAAVQMPDDEVTRSGRRLIRSQVCFVPCEGARSEGEEESKRHEVALFIGYTAERGEGGPTIGLDYTYWINERFGVGPFIDFVAGEIEAFAFGAGVWFRPLRRVDDLAFYVAPGLDIVHEEEHNGERSWEVKALLRLGVVYGFDAGGGIRLIPSLYLDVFSPDEQAYVMGLTIAREF